MIKRSVLIFLPFVITALAYKSMTWTLPLLRTTAIYVAEPYHLEMSLFGLAGQTPNQFLQANFVHPFLDFLCGAAYLTFTLEYVLLTLVLAFGLKKFKEGFFLASGYLFVNLAGFIIYHLYPAAPPWYVEQYGLTAAAILNAPAQAAGAARFDALVGHPFFAQMYAQSSNVFGAIPSLHVSYPFFAFLTLFFMRKEINISGLWIFQMLYGALMCFSAVYLFHHYMIDVIAGLLLTSIVFSFMHIFFAKRFSTSLR